MFIKALKNVLVMAVPMMSTRFVQTLNTFIMMLVLAQLGHVVLAATLTISMVRIVALLIPSAPMFSLGAIVSRQMNAEGKKHLPYILTQAWSLAFILSLFSMAILFLTAPILHLLHQPEAVVPVIGAFFRTQMWAMIPIMLVMACQQFLSGMKKQHYVTALSVISLCTNSFLVYGLTLGHFGFPALGVYGAALANVISASFGGVLAITVTLHCLPVRLRIKHWLNRSSQWFKLILKIGMPICLQVGSEMIVLMIITVMVGWLGEVAMGASQISGQYMLFAIVPIFGLSEAAAIRVGHAIADEQPKRIPMLGHASMLLSIAVVVLIGLVFAIFHKPLAHWFLQHDGSDSAAIYGITMILLAIRIFTMLFDGVADVTVGLLRGLYDTKYPMAVSLFTNWAVSLPLAYLFAFTFGFGVIGLAIGGMLARLLSTVVLLFRWPAALKKQLALPSENL
ncbi:MAG: MATE family efflux transporter [Coxiellaceae bacterium]|nr:MATE family efflux transporter [Coxiellaceae bacterium]